MTRIVFAASLATLGIALGHQRPLLLTVLIALLLGFFLIRWHAPADIAGLAAGAIIGNAAELLSVALGIWTHSATPWSLGDVPVWMLLCYPMLGLVTPRMTGMLSGEPPADARDGLLLPVALIGALVACAAELAGEALLQLSLVALLLALTLLVFPRRRDHLAALLGALLGFLWEVPGALSGAWRFESRHIAGLLPAWLPLGYAIFFICLRRAAAGLLAGDARRFTADEIA